MGGGLENWYWAESPEAAGLLAGRYAGVRIKERGGIFAVGDKDFLRICMKHAGLPETAAACFFF